MFVSVLKFCPNHVLLSVFTSYLKLSVFLEPSIIDGMNFCIQKLHQTSSAEVRGFLLWGVGGGRRNWGSGKGYIKILATTYCGGGPAGELDVEFTF